MEKKSSYQKVKEERDYLKEQLVFIANNPEAAHSKIILMRYKFTSNIEGAIMQGSPHKSGRNVF